MLYRLAADAVVLFHLAYVMFVVAGGLLVFKWRWVALLHLPAVVWGVLVELLGWICPLTPLELKLRVAGAQEAYSGSFIEHYIVPILYPAELDRSTQIALGIFVIVINIALYSWVAFPGKAANRKKRS